MDLVEMIQAILNLLKIIAFNWACNLWYLIFLSASSQKSFKLYCRTGLLRLFVVL